MTSRPQATSAGVQQKEASGPTTAPSPRVSLLCTGPAPFWGPAVGISQAEVSQALFPLVTQTHRELGAVVKRGGWVLILQGPAARPKPGGDSGSPQATRDPGAQQRETGTLPGNHFEASSSSTPRAARERGNGRLMLSCIRLIRPLREAGQGGERVGREGRANEGDALKEKGVLTWKGVDTRVSVRVCASHFLITLTCLWGLTKGRSDSYKPLNQGLLPGQPLPPGLRQHTACLFSRALKWHSQIRCP